MSDSLIKSVLKTNTLRQSLVTSVSTILNGFFGAAFYLLLAGFLGSQSYGTFSTATGLVAMLTSVFDLGTSQGIIKFLKKYQDRPTLSDEILKFTLLFKLITGALATIIFYFGAPFISDVIFDQPLLIPVLRLTGLAIMTSLLFSFITSLYQAREKFYIWGGLYVGTNFLRLILMFIFYFFQRLTDVSTLVIYLLLPLSGFVAGVFGIRRRFLSVKLDWKILREFMGFNSWVTGFIIISAVGARLDALFTTRFLTLELVGVYALAGQLVTIMTQLTTALGAVTAPKFSSFITPAQNHTYVIKATWLTLGVTAVCIVFLLPLSYLLFYRIWPQYNAAHLPFLILLAAMSIFLLSAPLRDSILYFYGKSHFFFYREIFSLVLAVIFSLLLIPRYGLIGSATSVLVVRVSAVLTTLWYYRLQHHRAS